MQDAKKRKQTQNIMWPLGFESVWDWQQEEQEERQQEEQKEEPELQQQQQQQQVRSLEKPTGLYLSAGLHNFWTRLLSAACVFKL